LAHCLHLDVVAEGIENTDQLVQLQAMDCQLGQGYLFAKPMPSAEATDYIADHLAGHRPDASDAA
jgi:EAL domain-containing protein (putative c-di-GMP-specific phosphodiesterase class I)